MFLQVVGDRTRVLPVDFTDQVTEDLLLPDDALSERVELLVAVGDVLVGRLRLTDQVLAVGKITTHFFADHHGKLIDTKLRRGSIVAPVVVVSPADRV